MGTGPSSWTSWQAWGLVPGTNCSIVANSARLYDEKTPGMFKTEWRGNGMVALCSKIDYWWDAKGYDKLSTTAQKENTKANVLT